MPRRVGLSLLAAFSALGLLSSRTVAADIHVKIQYHENVTETRPYPGTFTTYQTILLTLHDLRFAHEHREWQTGNERGVIDSDGQFGTMVKAGAYKVDWHVGGQNTLFRYKYGQQHTEKLTLKVSGDRCTAEISQHLKPGYSEYLRFGSHDDANYFSSIRPVVDLCEIQ